MAAVPLFRDTNMAAVTSREKTLKELKDKGENENTKNGTEYWKNVFKKWANEGNFQANWEVYESDVLDKNLSQFYAFRNSVILPSRLLTSYRSEFS